MKKSLLSILTLALVAIGCQNYDDQFDSLNTQITALTAKVDGLPPDTSASITAINAAISALETQVGTLGTSDLTAADLTTSLVDVLTKISDVKSDLVDLDADVATQIAGIATTVEALTTDLSDVAAAQLTETQVAALVAVTDSSVALTAVQESLNELLAADAALVGDLNIRNSAELLFAQSRIDIESANDYILQGNLNVNTTLAGSFPDVAAATTAINLLTSKITNVIGDVSITSATNVATGTIDITKLVYVSSSVTVTGAWNADTTVLTTAVNSISVPINDAHTNFVLTRLIAGGAVTLTDATSLQASPTVVDLSACTGCTTVGTEAGKLILPGAAVNLGSGTPEVITTVGSLRSTSSAVAPTSLVITTVADAITGADGSVELNLKSLTGSKIYADGPVTLSNSVATSFVNTSVIFAKGAIIVSAKKLTGSTNVISNTLSAAQITLGAIEADGLTVTASNTATIDASALLENKAQAASFSALEVILTGLITSSVQLDIVGDANIQLPALESSVGAINATTALIFNAPKLTTDGIIQLEEGSMTVDGADVTVKSLADINDIGDFVTINSLSIKGQAGNSPVIFNSAVLMETLNYAGLSTAAGTAQSNDFTYVVLTNASSLTSLNFTGNVAIDDVVVRAPKLSSFATEGGIRTLTVSSTPGAGLSTSGVLKTLTIGNTGLSTGDGSKIDIKDTGIVALDLSSWTKVKLIDITGNTSMTSIAFPSQATSATNVTGGTSKQVTVTNNNIAAVFSAGASSTESTAFVETSFTSIGVTNAKTWLNFLVNENTWAAGVTFTLEIDQVSAAIARAGADVATGCAAAFRCTAIWGTGIFVNEIDELGLLPN